MTASSPTLPAAATDGGPPVRRRAERLRTVAEQIADHLAIAIVNGEYLGGERIREQELAALYGASRAPVREAIRALSERGLVSFQPRRGAFVADLSLDVVADIFNMRAVLMGLAVRLIARTDNGELLERMRERITELEALVDTDDPLAFARATSRVGAVVALGCGSRPLRELLKAQVRHSPWGLLWRAMPLDFQSAPRRRAVVAEWCALVGALQRADEIEAERLQRRIHFNARDRAVEALHPIRLQPLTSNRSMHDLP